ncbi:hypothetical protein ACTA71_007006 [Dictyostelium dimigraforme]
MYVINSRDAYVIVAVPISTNGNGFNGNGKCLCGKGWTSCNTSLSHIAIHPAVDHNQNQFIGFPISSAVSSYSSETYSTTLKYGSFLEFVLITDSFHSSSSSHITEQINWKSIIPVVVSFGASSMTNWILSYVFRAGPTTISYSLVSSVPSTVIVSTTSSTNC